MPWLIRRRPHAFGPLGPFRRVQVDQHPGVWICSYRQTDVQEVLDGCNLIPRERRLGIVLKLSAALGAAESAELSHQFAAAGDALVVVDEHLHRPRASYTEARVDGPELEGAIVAAMLCLAEGDALAILIPEGEDLDAVRHAIRAGIGWRNAEEADLCPPREETL